SADEKFLNGYPYLHHVLNYLLTFLTFGFQIFYPRRLTADAYGSCCHAGHFGGERAALRHFSHSGKARFSR
ncbi:hypothetical protein, partial [Akkermansia sp.]|uniref:hypothetical protein n=1 Tax=Akkermansia sp. TaxID=1872421 RepID=UPI003A8935ED